MAQDFQLRDVFNPAVVDELANSIGDVWPEFDRDGFSRAINSQLESLSFGDRNKLIRDSLWEYLPKLSSGISNFPRAVEILLAALGPEIPDCEVTGYDGFVVMSQNDFVAKYGLDYFELSMAALYEMTKRFTAENAIRAFIERYPQQTMARLATWAEDENCHVRRLVSEGTRPRLPLASRLPDFIEDPRPALALLDKLKTDPELVVRRSVANNLNDIAKDNPAVVVETLTAWQSAHDPGTDWIIKHASRTLVKQGNKEVLGLLGYPPEVAIAVSGLELSETQIPIGGEITFEFEVQSKASEPQKLMVDYVVHHMKANGKLAPKVFKLAKKKLNGRETIRLKKKHSFRPLSTRKYYAGQHLLEIQINGKIYAQLAFALTNN
jgi:3-methyladenine DNA glycosylase AlkC